MEEQVRIILLQNLKDYGDMGDVLFVSTDFANNYLLPQGIAVLVTEKNLEVLRQLCETCVSSCGDCEGCCDKEIKREMGWKALR